MKKTLLPLLLTGLSGLLNAQCVGAVDLPTSTDYVQFSSPFYSYTNEITVEGWVYMDGSTNSTPWVGQATAGLDNMSTNVWHWHGANANELAWEVNDNGTWRHANSSTMSNGWHHVATVADNAGTRIYIDGVLDGSGPGISGAMRVNSNSEIHVGHDVRFAAGTGGRNGDYKMGELRVWNIARTQSEIAANMSSCLTGSESGLKLYNKFENGTGGVATSATGPNGTLVNMNTTTSWATGSGSECCTPASALNFDGANDVVSLPNGLPSMADMTIEGWIYPESISNFNAILNNSGWSNGLVHFQLAPSGQLGFSLNGNAPQDQTTSMVFTPNQWYHIAAVYSSANQYVKFYVNGVLVDTYAYTTAISTAANVQFEIGGWDGQRFFDGTMDELRIWNVARTQCEIISYMNCEIPSAAAGLLANYHFNQGVASGANATVITLTDASGNSNDGIESDFSLIGSSSNWVSPGGVTSGNVTPSVCTMASALNFDGNDYVSSPDQPDLNFGTGDFTIEANFKSSVSQSSYAGIVAKAGSGANIGFQLVLVNDRIAAEVSDGSTGFGTGQGLQGNTVLTDGNWHHMAMVVNRSLSQIQLFVDGNIEATVTNPAIATLNVNDPASLLIGVERTNGSYINGSLDEVRLWNVARTRCELISYKNCEVPTTATGLVANYHFNQGIDMMANPLITTLTDASGNAIDGTLSNFALTGSSSNWVSPGAVVSGFSTSVACPLASALNFDGYDDGVNLGNTINAILDPLNTITLEAWVNPSTVSGLGVIIGNYATGTNDMQFLLRRDFDEYAFWVSEGTGFKVVNSGPLTVVPGTWQHVAGVWDGSELKIYIDGVLKATTAGVTGSSLDNVSNPVIVGYNYRNENFSGNIDEIRMWTTARSQCEINTYKNCEIPTSSVDLLVNYHFNQGLASYSNPGEMVLSDVSGNGYNGSLNGFSLNGTTSNWTAPGGVVSGYTTALTPPVVTVNSGTICAGESFTMVPAGAITYTYSGGTDIVTPASDATFTVTGADAIGCENTAISSVTVNALPTVTVNSGTICAGQSFTMVPSGAVTFTYSNGSDVTMPTSDATYTVTGTDANGCENIATSSVMVNALPTIIATSTSTLLCTGETATLSVTGATSYTWSTIETTPDIAVTPTTTTTYTVDGKDANGCSNTTTITQDVSLCTGIAVLSGMETQFISVYPNPNNGSFYVELTTHSKVTITNALGQTIVNEEMATGKHELDLHNEVNGIYFVKVTQNNNQQVIKIIKE
jgi:hypothetical protein